MALNVSDVHSLVTELNELMTGQKAQSTSTAAAFTSIATITVRNGYDPIMNALSQMFTRTYYGVRSYAGQTLAALTRTNEQFGNMSRKVSFLESNAPETDKGFDPTAMADGQSVDMYVIEKSKPIEFHFYDQCTYTRHLTVFSDQLKVAMKSAEDLAGFIAAQYTHFNNMITTDKEAIARNCLCNFILAKTQYNTTASDPMQSTNTNHVVKLLSEYNALTGGSYTATTVFAPTVLPDFARFCVARIAEIKEMMAARTVYFHQNPDGLTGNPVIARHTPEGKSKLILVSKYGFLYDNIVKQMAHNPSAATNLEVEKLGYLQSPDIPDGCKGKYSALKKDGTVYTSTSAVTASKVIGVLFDSDAMGMTIYNEESAVTPYNASGRYTNLFHTFRARWVNDFTENGVVFTLA